MNKAEEQGVVGARLRQAREAIGFTQEDVADALGIARTSMVSMEAGTRSVSALELRRLARLYRRTTAWLIGDEELEPANDAQSAALYRATASLSEEDTAQVLRFAEFLAGPGGRPAPEHGLMRRRRRPGRADGPGSD